MDAASDDQDDQPIGEPEDEVRAAPAPEAAQPEATGQGQQPDLNAMLGSM